MKTRDGRKPHSFEKQRLFAIPLLGDFLIGHPAFDPAVFAVEHCLWRTEFLLCSIYVDCAPGHFVDRMANSPIPFPTAG